MVCLYTSSWFVSTALPKVVTVGIDFGCKNSRVAIIDSLVRELYRNLFICVRFSFNNLMFLEDYLMKVNDNGRYA